MGRYAERTGNRSKMESATVRGALLGMTGWLAITVLEAESLAPVETGRLARSIHQSAEGPMETDPLIFSGLFGTNVEYARAHELGSGIHALDPAARELILIEAGFWTGKSSKKALSFLWPGGPTDISSYQTDGPYAGKHAMRRVYHPGVRPAHGGRGYLRLAASNKQESGSRLVLEAIMAEWRRMNL